MIKKDIVAIIFVFLTMIFAITVIEVRLNELNGRITQLEKNNQELQLQIMNVNEHLGTDISPEAIKTAICALWGNHCIDALRVQSCEDGNLDPARINLNYNSQDVGLFQINTVHTKSVEAIFKQPFDEAMKSPWQNIIYAYVMWREQGFLPWYSSNRCHGLVYK